MVIRAEPLAFRTVPTFLQLIKLVQNEGSSVVLRGLLLTLPPGEALGGIVGERTAARVRPFHAAASDPVRFGSRPVGLAGQAGRRRQSAGTGVRGSIWPSRNPASVGRRRARRQHRAVHRPSGSRAARRRLAATPAKMVDDFYEAALAADKYHVAALESTSGIFPIPEELTGMSFAAGPQPLAAPPPAAAASYRSTTPNGAKDYPVNPIEAASTDRAAPPRPYWRHHLRCLFSQGNCHRHRQLGQDGQDLEPGNGPGRADPVGPRRRRQLGGICAATAKRSPRRAGTKPCAVERPRRPLRARRSRDTPASSRRRLSHLTAGFWSAAAGTRPSVSGASATASRSTCCKAINGW